jgi:hypothetical protein
MVGAEGGPTPIPTDASAIGHDIVSLPGGARLLHIGPPKTATTAVQSALWNARAALSAQGVHHAGRNRNAANAAHAVMQRPSQFTGSIPAMRDWNRLVHEIRQAREPRVVVSSETFSGAQPDVVRRIVRDLDPARIHVVITLRPLAAILPSQWQQFVQDGITASFDSWLNEILRDPPGRLTPTFWDRHRHDALVARWAESAGPAAVTVIALDDTDREMVLRVFERLLGLLRGTLVAERDLANRSMTWPEIEAVRAFNAAFRAAGLPRDALRRVIHFGAGQYMKRLEPDPDAPRVRLPAWALDRTAELAREIVDGIGATGVRVVGDLESLARVPAPDPAQDDGAPAGFTPEVAARLATGILVASGLARNGGGPERRDPGLSEGGATHGDGLPAAGRAQDPRLMEAPETSRIPTYVMAGVLAARMRDSVVSRARKLVSRR